MLLLLLASVGGCFMGLFLNNSNAIQTSAGSEFALLHTKGLKRKLVCRSDGLALV
jgi:hypothetical protein